MPLTLNNGFSRKVGERNYSSRGASVNLQVELEGGALRNPSQLRRDISNLFRYVREGVNEELARREPKVLRGQDPGEGGDTGAGHGSRGRPATPAQVRAIHAISRRNDIDLATLLAARFGCCQPDELSLQNASLLIDELNSDPPNG